MPRSNSRRLAAELGEAAALVELPGVGHCPQEECPEAVTTHVLDFLSAHGIAA